MSQTEDEENPTDEDGVKDQIDAMKTQMHEVKDQMGEVKTQMGEVKAQLQEVSQHLLGPRLDGAPCTSNPDAMKNEVESVKSQMREVKTEMNNQLHAVNNELQGIKVHCQKKKRRAGVLCLPCMHPEQARPRIFPQAHTGFDARAGRAMWAPVLPRRASCSTLLNRSITI